MFQIKYENKNPPLKEGSKGNHVLPFIKKGVKGGLCPLKN